MSEKSELNTSAPVQHPPRKAGQVWKWGDNPPRTLTERCVPLCGVESWSTTDGVGVAFCGNLTGWVFISPAKPAVDRTVAPPVGYVPCKIAGCVNWHDSLPGGCGDCWNKEYGRGGSKRQWTPPSGWIAPAPVVQAPVCLGCRKSPCNHGYVMCERGAGDWGRRETMGAVMLHETKLPERLPPARLAHSMGIEDPALEDC